MLNTFNLNGHILEIIYDSVLQNSMAYKTNPFILTVIFFFSVGQMAVSPSSRYSSLHLLMLALQVSLKMEHLIIVCDGVSCLENTKKRHCTEDSSQHEMQLPFCLAC